MSNKRFFLKNALKDNVYTYNKYFTPIDDDNNGLFSYNPSSLYEEYLLKNENNDIDEIKDGDKILISTECPELRDKKFFLFYFFQQCPSPYDERYKFIKKVSNKEYKHGLERSRCFEFEILARDPKNVYDIENTIDFYNKNYEVLKKYFHTPKKVQYIKSTEITEMSDLDKYKDQDNFICNAFRRKLQDLRLVEYKYFEEHEKFQHWAINPFIYEIMNWAIDNKNESCKYEIIDFPSGLQQIDQYKNIVLKSFASYTKEQIYKQNQEKINSWSRKIETLNDYTSLRTTVNLKQQSNHKFQIVHDYKAEFSNDSQNNEIIYSYHYPRCREYAKLSINIDLNRDIKQVKDLINETIDLIYKKFASEKVIEKNRSIDTDSMPYSLCNFETTIKGSVSLEEKFFAYDYITYRKEQREHKKLYSFSEEKEFMNNLDNLTLDKIMKLSEFSELDDKTKEHFYTLSLKDDKSKAKKFIISKIKKDISIKIDNSGLYQELSDLKLAKGKQNNILDSDSLEDYYLEIKNLINKLRSYSDFLSKK